MAIPPERDTDRNRFPSPRAALLLIAAGALLRLGTLSHHSLWLDETFSIAAATANTARTILTTGVDPVHPPLYYAILHGFLSVTGVSEVTARLPSAISSVAAIALIYWLGQIVFPHRAIGRVAAVLMALSPIDLWYAQETRMYSMVATAGLLLAVGLARDTWWAALLILGGLVAGLYLDHTMWPIAILLLGSWLIRWFHRRGAPALGRVVASTVAAGILCRPVYAQAVGVYGQLNQVSFFKNARRLAGLDSLTVVPFAWALIAFVGVSLLLAGLVWSASHHATRRRWLEYASAAGFVASTALVSVPRTYSLKQILVCVWPFFTLLAAWAIVSIDERRAHANRRAPDGALVAAVGVSLCALSLTFVTPRADWRGVAAYLSARAGSHLAIVLDPPWNATPYGYYRPHQPVVSGPVASREAVALASANVDEVCLIAERFGPRPPTSTTEAWLDAHLPLVSATAFSRLELRCYRSGER